MRSGLKIGFLGVTTPKTITSSTPACFQNEEGEYVYSFLQDCVKLDNQVLIDYIVDALGGTIGDECADPYGLGRIVIVED